MNIDAEREEIITDGANIRFNLIGLLSESYGFKLGLIRGGKQLKTLEGKFVQIYGRFLIYDGRMFEYLSETQIDRGIEPYKMELRRMGWEKLAAQRELVQSIVNNIAGSLSSARSELINRRAILIALIALVVSIILGIISIYVAYVAQPIILYPVK